ncbi:MAG: hypothetical protein AAFN44_02185, partial [Pseudomonadota bacterium]
YEVCQVRELGAIQQAIAQGPDRLGARLAENAVAERHELGLDIRVRPPRAKAIWALRDGLLDGAKLSDLTNLITNPGDA